MEDEEKLCNLSECPAEGRWDGTAGPDPCLLVSVASFPLHLASLAVLCPAPTIQQDPAPFLLF